MLKSVHYKTSQGQGQVERTCTYVFIRVCYVRCFSGYRVRKQHFHESYSLCLGMAMMTENINSTTLFLHLIPKFQFLLLVSGHPLDQPFHLLVFHDDQFFSGTCTRMCFTRAKRGQMIVLQAKFLSNKGNKTQPPVNSKEKTHSKIFSSQMILLVLITCSFLWITFTFEYSLKVLHVTIPT